MAWYDASESKTWYYSKEIKKIFTDKINAGMRAIVEDKSLDDDQIVCMISELRVFQKYADEIIADLEEVDRKEAEERAAEKAAREARKAKEAAEKAAREAKEGGSQ